jgi:ribonuclease J
MNNKKIKQGQLFWIPLAGNNNKTLGGNAQLLRAMHNSGGSSAIQIDFGNAKYSSEIKPYQTMIPDLRDIYNRKSFAVQGILLTHGHDDHIVGIAHHLKFGVLLPPIYGAALTLELLKDELIRFEVPKDKWPEMKMIRSGEKFTIGDFSIMPVAVSHSMPNCFAFDIEVLGRRIIHSGDLKLDQTVFVGPKTDLEYFSDLGHQDVDLLLVDSTKVLSDKLLISDAQTRQAITDLFERHRDDRIIGALYGGYLELFITFAAMCAAQDRPLIIDSNSVRRYSQALIRSGFDLHGFIREKTGNELVIIDGLDVRSDKDQRLQRAFVLTDGTRGEKNSSLGLAIEGGHPWLTLRKQDVLFATSGLFDLQGKFSQMVESVKAKGAAVYTSLEHGINARGHDSWPGLSQLIAMINPKHVIGCYGTEKMVKAVQEKCQTHFNITATDAKNGEIFKIDKGGIVTKIGYSKPSWIGLTKDEYDPKPIYRFKLKGPERD